MRVRGPDGTYRQNSYGLDTALDLFEQNLSPGEIAEQMGVSRRTVERYRHRLVQQGRIPPGRPTTWRRVPQEDWDRALEMLKDRSGYAEAARTVGLDRWYLARKFPGYALTDEEILDRMLMGQAFGRVSNHL